MVSDKKASWCATGLCVALLVLCVTLSHPIAETGISDDFSYTYSAKVLAETGRVAYNGWSTAMLGWMLYWGALFIRLLGFSEFAVRVAGLSIAMGTAALMHRLMLRFGLTLRNATLGTLAVVLSPLYLILSYAFMSDIPGLLALLTTVYCCLRALQTAETTEHDGGILAWLAAAVILGVILGSARQIAWMGVLVTVPSTLWRLRRRRTVLVAGVAFWLAGCLAVRSLFHWFQAQRYSLVEDYFGKRVAFADVHNLFTNLLRSVLELPFLILPIALGFVLYVRLQSRRTGVSAGALLAGVLSIAFWLLHNHDLRTWLQPTLLGALSDRGAWFIPIADDWQPIEVGSGWRLAASAASLLALIAMLLVWIRAGRPPSEQDTHLPFKASLNVFAAEWLLGPLLLLYVLTLLSRAMYSGIGDRYLLIVMVGAIILLLQYTQRSQPVRLQRHAQSAAAVTVAALSLFGIVSMHDMFALYRARLSAISVLRAEGVPRTAIRGQFEYDGTTEIMEAGYINEARLNPPGLFRPLPFKDWRLVGLPHVQPRFVVPVQYKRDACSTIRPLVPVGNLLGPPLVIETLPYLPKVPYDWPDICSSGK